MSTSFARALRGVASVWSELLSRSRRLAIKLRYPNVDFEGRVFISAGVTVQAGPDAHATIRNCHIGRGTMVTAGAGATLILDADYVGPNSVVVARERVTIGAGTKLAEMVVVRDANHDHSVPLSAMTFTSSPIEIGRDVWLGAGSVVLSGASIGDGATVAAGAVVTRSVAAGATVGGVPAQQLRRR
ncbi:acetyltransferase-like isoleucine patch superfamily enzyme [Phycicoccus badiiscoriae]|uniref:Acetyltransferase-like isoleucine patch superfamily enzyme n=1 Tax=Pedococcus badiiscoriae TaxID=642776 RepID=A0A852WB91_9MICO|nr:acyltransferase [Pedococcus badiiscoriae]NYG06079.1 acetyltransferase-like isoleucine patch superfamily enzyme [Pedococcus badiiscoriae]